MAITLERAASGLEQLGITPQQIYWNLAPGALYEEAVRRNEAHIAHGGALVSETGKYTGRSPNDKFVVKEPSSEANIWWGKVNSPFDSEKFDALEKRVAEYLSGKELFVQDCRAGADDRYGINVRIVSEYAWHSLFVQNQFIRLGTGRQEGFKPDFTVIDAAKFKADPERDGTRSECFILLNFAKKLVLIGGTSYAGEIKKSVFTILNYILPLQGVLSMHCSANIGPAGDTALFFGLSGTGKTTLSSDPSRRLIGDDEHGWSDRGVFNFEGGCYAKCIKLSAESEPQIYAAIHRFGAVLENVVIDPVTRKMDLDDASLTENTRANYPLDFIENAELSFQGGHPRNVMFLTCDAFGVLPPISKLSPEQAMYHFLSGYTAKVAGTEKGMGDEPQATFSTCFGAPFLPLPPFTYAKMLAEKLQQHKATCWLVNTGWSAGPFGVGHRISIKHTRTLVNAALNGELEDVPTSPDPIFGVHIPASCSGVPVEILQPKNTWADKTAYDQKAKHLAQLFNDNFKQFEEMVTPEVRAAAPKA
jgi:phosphoenolpyruvate carboxykinase (ATP)